MRVPQRGHDTIAAPGACFKIVLQLLHVDVHSSGDYSWGIHGGRTDIISEGV